MCLLWSRRFKCFCSPEKRSQKDPFFVFITKLCIMRLDKAQSASSSTESLLSERGNTDRQLSVSDKAAKMFFWKIDRDRAHSPSPPHADHFICLLVVLTAVHHVWRRVVSIFFRIIVKPRKMPLTRLVSISVAMICYFACGNGCNRADMWEARPAAAASPRRAAAPPSLLPGNVFGFFLWLKLLEMDTFYSYDDSGSTRI